MVLILVAFVGSAPGEIPPATVATALPPPKETAVVLAEITEWIMGLDLGSGTVKGYDHGTNHLNRSIFINGNLARVLMGSYRVNRNESHLREALAWCDVLVRQQVAVATADGKAGGFWGVGYGGPGSLADGNIYLGDTGTAVTALSLCHELTLDPGQRERFGTAMTKYFAFVVGGCSTPGCGYPGRGSAPATGGFINASAGGAIGCGYYEGHLSTCPYVIATGTTGAAFGSELLNIVGAGTETGAVCAKMVGDAVGYMASLISASNATIPYVIDCQPPDWTSWPLDTLTYVTEGMLGAYLHTPENRAAIIKAIEPIVEWLLAHQNAEGFWGSTVHAADLQRSPRVATLLSLRAALSTSSTAPLAERKADPRLGAALAKYVKFLAAKGKGPYGVNDILNTSGFVGLALIDMLQFGATFGTPKAH